MAQSKTAYLDLLDEVEKLFLRHVKLDNDGVKVYRTPQPPIYLQRPRHSLTIVGIVKLHAGSRALVVFDPAYSPPKDLSSVIAQGTETRHPKAVLKAYCREERYLKRYQAFEILHVDVKTPDSRPSEVIIL